MYQPVKIIINVFRLLCASLDGPERKIKGIANGNLHFFFYIYAEPNRKVEQKPKVSTELFMDFPSESDKIDKNEHATMKLAAALQNVSTLKTLSHANSN